MRPWVLIVCLAACSSESGPPAPEPAPIAVEHPDPDPPAVVAAVKAEPVPAIIEELEKHAAGYREPAKVRALVPYLDKGKWGYADRTTYEVVIAPRYDGADGFDAGRAVVNVGDKCGVIDSAGVEVIEPHMYACAGPVDGLMRVWTDDDHVALVDTGGKPIDRKLHGKLYGLGEGYYGELVDKRVVLYDHHGTPKLATALAGAGAVSDGLVVGSFDCGQFSCPVGALDVKTAEPVVGFVYDDVHDFHGGFAFAQKGGKWGVLDKAGKEVVPLKYAFIMNSARDELWVANEKFGEAPTLVFDHTGAQVASIPMRLAASFTEGLAPFEVGEGNARRVGFVDRTGKVVIPARFGFATGFHRGVAWVTRPGDDKAGLIDKTGNVVVPLKYGSAADYVTIYDDDTTPVRESPDGPGRRLMFWIDRSGHEFMSADTRAWFAKQPHPPE